MKKEFANYPWVFWFHISYRPKWFSMFWKTRGSNYVEYQLWIFQVSIGRPWLKRVIESHKWNYGSAKHAHQVNMGNLKKRFSILIKLR